MFRSARRKVEAAYAADAANRATVVAARRLTLDQYVHAVATVNCVLQKPTYFSASRVCSTLISQNRVLGWLGPSPFMD